MKFLVALLCLAQFSGVALVQGAPKKAMEKAELTSLLAYYQSITKLKARFKERKTLKDLSYPLLSEGLLTVQRPDRVVWEITKPSPLVVTLDRKELSIESGAGKTKKREAIAVEGNDKAAESLKGLVAWLRLDPTALLEEYRIYSLGNHEYEMVPKRAGATPFDSLTMTLKEGAHLEALSIREKSGDSIVINFERPEIERAR